MSDPDTAYRSGAVVKGGGQTQTSHAEQRRCANVTGMVSQVAVPYGST